jgi:hypothetical protein
MSSLGRRIPTTWTHVDRYPLTATTTPARPVPVTLGVNWYAAFDEPQRDSKGRYWIGRRPLSTIRGGHCVCLEPGDPVDGTLQDYTAWWPFYDQGREGACVGFGSSRMMSLLNRKRYDARWLWNRAKEVDEWPDTNPGDDNGTSVRAAMDVLRAQGHKPSNGTDAKAGEGISANRWARTVAEVLGALQSPASERIGAVRVLNSWGKSFPHRVWLPLEVLQRLLDENGEATVVVDR